MTFDNFKSFSNDLQENSLYADDTERAALVADKSRVASAFMFNFFGMLGLINAATPTQRGAILKFLRKDKQVRLSSIGSDNHDISLSVKLAHEADFFKQDTTANEITKFLFKLKSGQVDSIDSRIVARWADGLVPSFRTHLKDPKMKMLFDQFAKDGGATIDVSRFAVKLKKVVNKVGDGGDYERYAKRYFGLKEITPQQATTTAVDPTQAVTTTDPVTSTADPVQTAPIDTSQPPANPAAPKLSYYQRQKAKKDAEKAAVQKAAQIAAEQERARLEAERDAAKAAAAADVDVSQLARDILPIIIARQQYGYTTQIFYAIRDRINMTQARVVDDLPDNVKQLYYHAVEFIEQLDSIVEEYNNGNLPSSFSSALDLINRYLKDKISASEFIQSSILDFANASSLSYSTRKRVMYFIYLAPNYQLSDNIVRQLLGLLNDVDYFVFLEVYRKLPTERAQKDLLRVIADTPQLAQRMSVENTFRYFSRSWSSGVIELSRNSDITSFLFDYIVSMDKNIIGYLYEQARTSYFLGGFMYALNAYGGSKPIGMSGSNISRQTHARMEELFQDFIKNEMLQNHADTILERMFISDHITDKDVYDPQASDKGGVLMQTLYNAYAADIEQNGFESSELGKYLDFSDQALLKKVARTFAVDLMEMIAKFDKDPSVALAAISVNGLASLSSEAVADVIQFKIDSDRRQGRIANPISTVRHIRSKSAGDRDENHDAMSKAMLILARRGDAYIDLNERGVGEELMNTLANSSSATILDWMRFARGSSKQYIMSADLYKSVNKNNKSKYVEVLTGIVLDSIGSDVEDYVNDIVEQHAPHVKQKMRSSLVGSQVLIDEIEKGVIQPFDKVDNTRLKKIFLYNDINMSAITSGVVDKKKKSETYVQYFLRARTTIAQKQGLLSKLHVTANDTIDAKVLNKTIIQRDHAGRHGDVFPKILKVFDGTLRNKEFDDFRATSMGDGSVTPAFHGTGGIAASMILRYGFKVIKSSDASVVGRMLGDGIYFSNKIDKAMQYVSNGGYSKRQGQKGYIVLMDTNLGSRPTNYRVAGLGNDNIRSPEWCVFDPLSQLRVLQVYEVELNTKNNVDKYLAEGVYSKDGISTFKNYINEQQMKNYEPTTTFVFRDGKIPIVDLKTQEVEYVDFEIALRDQLLPEELYDITSQGPAVIFNGTPKTELYDERYAEMMVGDSLQLYKQYFIGYKKHSLDQGN